MIKEIFRLTDPISMMDILVIHTQEHAREKYFDHGVEVKIIDSK